MIHLSHPRLSLAPSWVVSLVHLLAFRRHCLAVCAQPSRKFIVIRGEFRAEPHRPFSLEPLKRLAFASLSFFILVAGLAGPMTVRAKACCAASLKADENVSSHVF